jgi:hypothetical protein
MTEFVRGTSIPRGTRLVSSLDIPERRKSAAEIRRMSIEDRLIYARNHPETELQKQEALEREDRDAHYEAMGEVDYQDILDNEPPSSWGR